MERLTLHEARLKKNVGLQELSTRTSLSATVVRRIDEGRFDDLPPGVYARSYIKAFAAEVGLDPAEALRQVEHLLPGAPDPLPVMRELKGPSVSERLFAFVQGARQRPAPAAPAVQDAHEEPAHEEDEHSVLRPHLTRLAAAAVDALFLVGMNASLVVLIAAGAGLPTSLLLRHGLALAGFCAVPTIVYFVLFAGIGGRTVGGWVCRVPIPPPHAPLTLDAIFRRSITAGASDSREHDLSRPALVGR